MINPTEYRDILRYIESKKDFFLKKDLTKNEPSLFVIRAADNTFDIDIGVFVRKVTDLPTLKTFEVNVYVKGNLINDAFLIFTYEEHTIITYKSKIKEVNSKHLPTIKKDKIVLAKFEDYLVFKKDNDIFTNYVDDFEIEADGFEINADTIIFATYEEIETFKSTLPVNIQKFIEPVREILSNYTDNDYTDNEIFMVLSKNKDNIDLLSECPISISDTSPREIILDIFADYSYNKRD
jgi:hypothetical protein